MNPERTERTTAAAERVGLLFAALCAVNGAFVPAFAKLTTNRGAPMFVAAITTLFAGACAAAVLSLRGELHVLARRDRVPGLLLVGALGTATAFVLFFSGAGRSTAIETALCLQIEPAYSLLLTWLVLGHRPTRRRLLALSALLAGITLAIAGPGLAPSSGAALLLATPLCWQLSHLVVLKRLAGVSPAVLTGARYIYGGAILALCWLASGGSTGLSDTAAAGGLLPLLALQGVILSYAGTLFWYQAIARLDLSRCTAIVVPSIPALSLITSFALLGEVPTAYQAAGLALTVGGIAAFVTAPRL